MKLQLILLACVLASFAAGTSVGVLWERSEKHPPTDEGWLAELNMTSEQRTKIKAIWSEAMATASWQAQREKREVIQKERDDAIKIMITADAAQKYEETMRIAKEKQNELAQQSKKTMDEAYEKTKALLNETQRVKYDELRQKRFANKGRNRTGGSKE